MAIRNIRTEDDEVLRKKAKEVDAINDKIITLLDDMAQTMYKADGVGLAAPQVGVLKRVVVIDAGEGLLELINPVVIEESGEQVAVEGCLSVTKYVGEVKRAEKVVVEALDRNGKRIRVEGHGLLARALSHETDHLDGVLFIDKAIKLIKKDELEEE